MDVWVNRPSCRSSPRHSRQRQRDHSGRSDLYNVLGKNFAGQSDLISQVNVQTPTGFYSVMGPVARYAAIFTTWRLTVR